MTHPSDLSEDNQDLFSDAPTHISGFDRAVARIVQRDKESRERVWSFAELCDEWVFITEMDRFVLCDDPKFGLKKSQFNDRFAYCKPDTKQYRKEKLNTVSAVMFAKSRYTIRKPMRAVFFPGEEPGMLGADYNLYTRSEIEPREGDTALWDEHLAYLLPDEVDRNHVLNWLGWLYQNMTLKPKHALLLAGHVQGTGKTFIADVFTKILGERNVSPVNTSMLSSQFNRWALSTKLIVIEELDAVERNVVKHSLHPLITEARTPINDKGVPTFEIENCFGIFAMTNEDAALRLTRQDRRYLVVRTHAKPREAAYYNELYEVLTSTSALAAIAHQLQQRDLGNYNGQARAPDTAAKTEMIVDARGDLEDYLHEYIETIPDLVTVQQIISMLPSRLQRNATRDVTKFFRHELNGKPFSEALRLGDGSRLRVWALRGKHDEVSAMTPPERAAFYENCKTRVAALEPPVTEFDEPPPPVDDGPNADLFQ